MTVVTATGAVTPLVDCDESNESVTRLEKPSQLLFQSCHFIPNAPFRITFPLFSSPLPTSHSPVPSSFPSFSSTAYAPICIWFISFFRPQKASVPVRYSKWRAYFVYRQSGCPLLSLQRLSWSYTRPSRRRCDGCPSS